MELALVFARLLALLRSHLLPLADSFTDFLAPGRRKGDPVIGALEHVRLPAWRHAVPFLLQRRQYLALGRIQTVPGLRRRWRRSPMRWWRHRFLGPQRWAEGAGERDGKQQWQDGAQMVAHGVQRFAGWLSLAANQP